MPVYFIIFVTKFEFHVRVNSTNASHLTISDLSEKNSHIKQICFTGNVPNFSSKSLLVLPQKIIKGDNLGSICALFFTTSNGSECLEAPKSFLLWF